MKYCYWALLWILVFLVGVVGRILSPLAVIFIVRSPRLDTVKRLGKKHVELQRDNLVWWLIWFATDDNAVDEYWYGWYDKSSTKTQQYYDTHAIYRWYCRAMWLNRNSMCTLNRKFFGLNKGSSLAWQYKADIPLLFGYYNSVNIGFKSHKGIDRLMYAGRIIGLRHK